MNWTKEKPTKRGFYWYRRNPGNNEIVVCIIGERYLGKSVGGTPLMTPPESVSFSGDEEWRPLAEMEGEWQGPLTPINTEDPDYKTP